MFIASLQCPRSSATSWRNVLREQYGQRKESGHFCLEEVVCGVGEDMKCVKTLFRSAAKTSWHLISLGVSGILGQESCRVVYMGYFVSSAH